MFFCNCATVNRFRIVTLLRQSLSTQTADKNLLLKLRRSTGFTFSACKEALIKHNNDFNSAVAWLKEEAIRRGWDKASRLSHRPLSQGLLGVQSSPTHVAIVEVNCETDFVAKNEQFQKLVASVTEAFMSSFREKRDKTIWNSTEMGELIVPDTNLRVADKAAAIIGAVGENLLVRRGLGMCVDEPHGPQRLAVYTHPSGVHIHSGIRDVHFGKYAAVIRYRPMGDQPPNPAWSDRAARLGRQLCQHIVGMNPRPGLDLSEPSSDPDEEKCFLLQPFILDETVQVGEHLKRNDMILEDFVRVECGQDDEEIIADVTNTRIAVDQKNCVS